MIRTLIVIISIILLSSCAAPVAEATQTPTHTPDPTITATATIEPTATVTVQPTESPSQIATELGLNATPFYDTRTFAVMGNYLIDTYNNVPKAVLETGTWRKLDYADPEDAEMMYGALVPTDGEYIIPEMNYTKDGPRGRRIGTRLLGDWEVGEVDYEGKRINLYYLLVGLRDGGGQLHIVRVAYDSPDIKEHWTTFKCYYGTEFGQTSPGGGLPIFAPLAESLAHLRVGEDAYLMAYEYDDYEQEKVWESPDYPLVLNTAKERLMSSLYNDYPDRFRLTAVERAALDDHRWPERVVTLATPGGVALTRDSEDDCYK